MKQMNVTSKSIVGGKLLTVCAAAHSPNRPLGENRSSSDTGIGHKPLRFRQRGSDYFCFYPFSPVSPPIPLINQRCVKAKRMRSGTMMTALAAMTSCHSVP